jgi:hypothetical protein
VADPDRPPFDDLCARFEKTCNAARLGDNHTRLDKRQDSSGCRRRLAVCRRENGDDKPRFIASPKRSRTSLWHNPHALPGAERLTWPCYRGRCHTVPLTAQDCSDRRFCGFW